MDLKAKYGKLAKNPATLDINNVKPPAARKGVVNQSTIKKTDAVKSNHHSEIPKDGYGNTSSGYLNSKLKSSINSSEYTNLGFTNQTVHTTNYEKLDVSLPSNIPARYQRKSPSPAPHPIPFERSSIVSQQFDSQNEDDGDGEYVEIEIEDPDEKYYSLEVCIHIYNWNI
jgi:hypothetical protein